MKDANFIATAEKNVKNLISSEQIKIIKENIFYFVLSIFISKGMLFGTYTPFGTAFLAAVPYKNMLFSLIGSIIAYILPSEIDIGIRYVVLNTNNLRAIDVDSINDIIEYNKKILKDQRRLLICDANNSRKRIFSNNIQKINCEIDAFSLI